MLLSLAQCTPLSRTLNASLSTQTRGHIYIYLRDVSVARRVGRVRRVQRRIRETERRLARVEARRVDQRQHRRKDGRRRRGARFDHGLAAVDHLGGVWGAIRKGKTQNQNVNSPQGV
jgi:hypothetical protein